MAKLSDAQKVENKAASKARAQAYNARQRAKLAAQDVLDRRKAALPEWAAVQAADAVFDEAVADCNRRRAELLRQVAVLRAEIARVDAMSGLEEAKLARLNAWSKYNARGQELDDALDAEFADLKGVYGPAQWRRSGDPASGLR